MPFALCQENSQPLSVDERRLVLIQLMELKLARREIAAYQAYVERDAEQDAREKALAARELEVEKKATANETARADIAQDKANYWESAYKAVTKKPGVGCKLKKVFTLGIARCS